MKDRIRQLMEAQHMNQQAFAQCTGIGTASLSSIFTGRTRPTLNHVEAIMNKFPNVNPMWLLQGTGGMFLTADEAAASAIAPATQSGSRPTTSADELSVIPAPANMAEEPNLFSVQNATNMNVAPTHSNGRGNVVGVRFETGNRGNGTAQGAMAVQPQQAVPTPPRKIMEIRVYYDDQSWESFTPRK